MRSSANIYYLITTMNGIPILDENGAIKQFISTHSVRQHAKHATFHAAQRYHTRGVSKDTRHRINKYFHTHGYIPLGMLR